MAIIAAIIQSLLKAAVFGFLAFLGIKFGKKYRDSKDAKKAQELEMTETN